MTSDQPNRRTPSPNKEAALGLRVSPELKDTLHAEAASANQTLSQVAIRWIEAGRRASDTDDALRDLSPTGDTVRNLIAFEERVRERIGDPRHDAYAREALVEGWRGIAARFPLAPTSPEHAATLRSHMAVRAAARGMVEVLGKIEQRDPESPLLAWFTVSTRQNLFAPSMRDQIAQDDRRSAAELLLAIAAKEGERTLPFRDFRESRAAAARLSTKLSAGEEALNGSQDAEFLTSLATLYTALLEEAEADKAHWRRRLHAIEEARTILDEMYPEPDADAPRPDSLSDL